MKELFKKATHGPWITSGLDVQYRIEMEGVHASLFFQQTVSKSDWMLNFATVPYKDMAKKWSAHTGFVKLYKSVADEIADRLAVLKPESLLVSGFSQGAALATLAHEDMGFRFPDLDVETVVFGSPRVLWFPTPGIAKRWLSLTRYYTMGDPVTGLPPWAMGYAHVGQGIAIGPFCWPPMTGHDPAKYAKYL